MAHAILMPKPGQMTEECSIVEWHKKEGDPVHRGDILFEIETDKSIMDVEAFDEGVLLKIVVQAGQSVAVNAVCAYVGEAGEAVPDAPAPVAQAPAVTAVAAPAAPAAAPATAPTAPAVTAVAPIAPATAQAAAVQAPVAVQAGHLAISPRAAKLAAGHGIDPRTLTGTGPDGRIVERDVQARIAAPTTPAAASADGQPRQMSRMRRVIAERLTASWTTTPHFTVTVAVDMTRLMALRAELKAAGTSLTVTDFVLAATADTLADFPDVNSRTDGVSVWPRSHVHLGMAVAVPGGLVVPVIRNAETLTVSEVHNRAATLAQKAREGTASIDDLTGSTFTVSNLGMLGVEEFSAIINPGEAAILAVSAAIPTPVAVNGAVEVRSVMKLTLSADHRIVDGAMGAQFLKALRGRLEDADAFRLGVAAPARPRFAEDPNWFDLVVLGAGTGGYTAAFRAAQLGMKVALVDADKIGGTCLHRGCIPTKAILESADLAHRIGEDGAGLGVVATGVSINYAATAANKDAIVKRMWTGLKSLVGKNGVEWVSGRGRLDGPSTVAVTAQDGTTRRLTANDVILATGSRVKSLPGIVPDGVRVVTSDDVLRWTSLPSSIVVVGAGAVGSEFASGLHDLGVRVTLLEYLPAIVPLEDAEVSKELQRSFERRGITVMTSARFDAASLLADENGVRLTVGPDGGNRTEVSADCILVAAGRATNVEDLGLETTRVRVDRGYVAVDGHMRTDEPHVWAIGDIVGGLLLAHTAAHEGLTAVHTMIGDAGVHAMDYVQQPRATYTRPEIASVGLTEQQCADRGLTVKVGKVPFQAVAKALIHGSREGFAKVIAHAETGAVLGVHIIGPHATELIAEASLAATLSASVDAIGATTHPHPTLSEILGEAAMAVTGRSINF